MATRFTLPTTSRAAVPPLHRPKFTDLFALCRSKGVFRKYVYITAPRVSTIRATNGGGDSYMDMWRNAVDREKKTMEFERMAENSTERDEPGTADDLERKTSEFQKLLEVPAEERDRVQRMQVIDRAAAAIAAARALLKEKPPQEEDSDSGQVATGGNKTGEDPLGKQSGNSNVLQTGSMGVGTPGLSFWAWEPPAIDDGIFNETEIKPATQASPSPAQSSPVQEQERGPSFLLLPFESSMIQNKKNLPLPPLQSLVEVEEVTTSTPETSHKEREQELDVEFSTNAAEAADALSKVEEVASQGVNPDGSRWWKETGIEQRPDGVICKWTLTRGVSADKATEWETKYWEAADDFRYKELGSEKSGRDAMGSVWREFWRESMMRKDGFIHLEKTADKWGKNIQGDEWQEQWWEHYDHSGRTEKWAHKWCSIDPHTPIDIGHAHIWHERWGEKYDGQGGSTKYTDKWAERFEADGWSKWGDKWDEHFDPNSRGTKQGETWWEGKYGERWNRTWGEGHNGSGWVHKYGKSSCGKSSCGEHWDTHVQQDTWYERFPHYDFYHCLENSVQLREVQKPSAEDSSSSS